MRPRLVGEEISWSEAPSMPAQCERIIPPDIYMFITHGFMTTGSEN